MTNLFTLALIKEAFGELAPEDKNPFIPYIPSVELQLINPFLGEINGSPG